MEKPDWYYDDLKQVGTDFADAREVATYDERQNDSSAEDRALLLELGLPHNTGYDRATVAYHLRDEHSTYGWIMEGLIKQAGFDILSAEYSNGVYADYIAVKPRPQ